jgi:putative ABC transport system permease protein
MAVFHMKNKHVHSGDRKFLALRIVPQNSNAWRTTFARLNKVWKQHAGDTPFEYSFVDQVFAETFKTQQQLGKVLMVLSVLAILIASLGLLGMIVYALEQRMKEIGIRKVSGASVSQILVLISKGYTKLILIAFFIGSPLAYWLMHEWLRDFAYRVTPSISLFFIIGASTLVVAVFITGYHSVKAALMNPVDILRHE